MVNVAQDWKDKNSLLTLTMGYPGNQHQTYESKNQTIFSLTERNSEFLKAEKILEWNNS